MNVKLNFILTSDQLQQFHIGLGSPKLTINQLIWHFIFFAVVIQEERPRTYPLTITEGREGLNAVIPESKALFVVWRCE